MKIICSVCPQSCRLEENETGFCRARKNISGKIESINYGIITSIALDPIEKKPLYHFHPGKKILSVGSFGCNFRCQFCQNYQISMCGADIFESYNYLCPEQLVKVAIAYVLHGNIGLAFTYNEPLIGYEYVRDCAKLAKENNLLNVVVTNGFACEDTLEAIIPYIDAMNIDLKAFNRQFYSKIKGNLERVKQFITLAAKHCHIEITNLIIPGENDGIEENTELAKWIASINEEIPLHISRFFPRYNMTNKMPTDIKLLYELKENAKKFLKHVYTGNC